MLWAHGTYIGGILFPFSSAASVSNETNLITDYSYFYTHTGERGRPTPRQGPWARAAGPGGCLASPGGRTGTW